MNVLTWHGAVLRVDPARQRLVQDPVWMTAPDGQDFAFDAASPSPLQTALGSLEIEPAGGPSTVRFASQAGYLSATPGKRDLSFEPDEAQSWHSFLLIGADDLADLRHILAHRWRIRPSGQLLEKADVRIMAGFGLALGPYLVELPGGLPFTSYTRRVTPRGTPYLPPASFVVRPGDEMAETIELADGTPQTLARSQQFELLPRRAAPPQDVTTREAFMRTASCRFTLPPAAPRYAAPPLVTRARDRDLFVTWLEGQRAPAIGFIGETFEMRREQRRYVMLTRGAEGVIFDQDGVSVGDVSAIAGLPRLPSGFTQRDGRVWVSRDALEEVPRLDGPLLIFYDRFLDSYARWLTGAMPALDAITRHAPRGVRLLLPSALTRMPRGPVAFEHREVMNLLGFSRLPATEHGADLIWADDVVFPGSTAPDAIPSAQLYDFRDRVLLPHGGPGEPTRRIYIRPAGEDGLPHGHEVERTLTQQGFEHVVLEQLSQQQRMDLFREASFVVGAHSESLSDVVFSPPGLRVIELMSDTQFRPDIWKLCGKLGHLHGFLGGPAEGNALDPDPDRFRDLLSAIESFRL